MATLFIVNRSTALADCLVYAREHDSVLLIEDGVYGAVRAPAALMPLMALQADVEARGLTERLCPSVQIIDDDGFVALAAAHQPIVTWG